MNLREIINGARPDSAEPYYKLDREERHLAAILFHLLQQPPNREILLKHAGCVRTRLGNCRGTVRHLFRIQLSTRPVEQPEFERGGE